jgi:hypothetical protein
MRRAVELLAAALVLAAVVWVLVHVGIPSGE